jgi:hypothetical protein
LGFTVSEGSVLQYMVGWFHCFGVFGIAEHHSRSTMFTTWWPRSGKKG